MEYTNIYNSLKYRPIYRSNGKNKLMYNTFFPYLTNDNDREKINLQVFYNTMYKNGIHNSEQLGSTYKYTIPKSIDDDQYPSYSSISERQKRRSLREFFGNENIATNNIYNKTYTNMYFIFILILFIIIVNYFYDNN